jgi:hypothetical protein
MSQEDSVPVSEDELSVVAAMAAVNSGLHQTILALAAGHGGKSGPWLDQLEADLLRDTKNIVFEGASYEAEAEAIEYALENLRGVIGIVRQRLDSPSA